MRKVWLVVVASLLSGCASDDPGGDADDPTGVAPGFLTPFSAEATPLRFTAGDFEGNLTGEATYSITGQCIMIGGGCTDGEEVFDLSEIIPANAPVELTAKVHGAQASLEFVDASAIGVESGALGDFDGQSTNFAALVTRADSGKVLLHVYNPGGFEFPPNPAPTATWEAHSVVRADRLVAGIPAGIKLKPGDTLNLTSENVEEALLIAPDGSLTRDQTAPFTLMANSSAGTYIVMMQGADSTAVTGPEGATMVAMRLMQMFGDVQALTSGSAATWSFTPESRPLAVGVHLTEVPTADQFAVALVMTQYEIKVTAPGGVDLIHVTSTCNPTCGFSLIASGFMYGFSTEYLDERLQPGQYDVSVTYTGNGMQAQSWALVIV